MVGIPGGLAADRCVDHQLDIPVLNMIHHVGTAFADLHDDFRLYPVTLQLGGCPARRQNLKTHSCGKIRRPVRFYPYAESWTLIKTFPSVGKLETRGHLGFGEGQAEGMIDPHDLSGGLHLRPQENIHIGKAAEGEDRLLDGNVVRMEGRP